MKRCWFWLCGLFLGGCATGIPEGIMVVPDFSEQRLLGQWYEIARLDHSFERGLIAVNATYSLNADGSIRVVNRGYDPEKGRWREAVGRARRAGNGREGALEVSFFGPFYGSYNIVDMDVDDRWLLVVGPNRGYLWLLARQPQMPAEAIERYLAQAAALGFPVDQLIRVPHPADLPKP